MPLTRDSVTVAQRVMTVVHVLLAGHIGWAYTFKTDNLRDNSAAYADVDRLLPLVIQGVGFLGIATMLGVAMLLHSRQVYVVGLAWMTLWVAVLVVALGLASARGEATVVAFDFPAYVVCGCWASMLSLVAREK